MDRVGAHSARGLTLYCIITAEYEALLQCWVRHRKADMALLFSTLWLAEEVLLLFLHDLFMCINDETSILKGSGGSRQQHVFLSFFPSSFHLSPDRKPCIITCIIMTYYLITLFEAIEFRLETIEQLTILYLYSVKVELGKLTSHTCCVILQKKSLTECSDCKSYCNQGVPMSSFWSGQV